MLNNLKKWIGLISILALALGACDIITGNDPIVDTIVDPCPAADGATAATLVSEGKAALEAVMNSGTRDTFGQIIDDSATKFDQALTLCSTNEEAAFFASLFQFPLFLDGQTTTDLLSALGMGTFRVESELATPFDPATKPIIGGTDTYVDLSAADAMAYLSAAVPGSLGDSVSLLADLPATFSTTLTVPDDVGGTKSLGIDYADTQVLRALFTMSKIPFLSLAFWQYPGFDEFMSASGVRDPTTGDYTTPISALETQSYIRYGLDGTAGSGDEPLSANAAGMTAWSTAMSNVFGALQGGIDSLLGETDTQADDLVVLPSGSPEFDAEEEVGRLVLLLFADMAGDLSTSFQTTSSTGADLNVLRLIFSAGASGCDPLADDGVTDSTGTTMTPVIYKSTTKVALGNVAQVMGAAWDNSNRTTLTLYEYGAGNDSLLFDQTTVTSEVKKILPNATVTILPAGATVDLFGNSYDVTADDASMNTYTDVTSQFSGVPALFCANLGSFNTTNDFPGKYEM